MNKLPEVSHFYIEKASQELIDGKFKWDSNPYGLFIYDISDINFIGKDLNRFRFTKLGFIPVDSFIKYTNFVPKGFYSAIFHEDPETNQTIIKMLTTLDTMG